MKRTRALKIGQVVGLGFGLTLFLASFIGLLGRLAYDISRWQRETIQIRGDVERLALQLEILSIQRTEALRRYLDTADATWLSTYQTRQSDYDHTYSRLANLLNTPKEKAALQDVVVAGTAFNDKAQEILHLYDNEFQASARFLWMTEGVLAQNNLIQTIEKLRLVQGETSTAIINQALQNEIWAIAAVSFFVPLMLLGGIVAGLLIARSITKPISNLVKGITLLGADLNVRVEPSGPQEIAFLGETINGMAANLLKSSQSLQAYKDRLEQELKLASQIQASFLPSVLPQSSRLELAVFWKSAREVGGDFYTYVNLGDGRQGIAVGDVSGKGAPAAMAGALTEGLLEAYAPMYAKPEALLTELNKDLSTRLAPNHMNVACCYAIIDESLSCLTVANAGCIYPYLRRDNTLHEIAVGGMPLGAWANFDYSSLSIPLQPGDLIIFSTDGLVEARNEQKELLGFERFRTELRNLPSNIHAQKVVDQLVDVAMNFTDQEDLNDDITILVARILESEPDS
jgi:serine phosphatase RsbU (regulator of sigma subunit)/CHASE3 domain sensor protein